MAQTTGASEASEAGTGGQLCQAHRKRIATKLFGVTPPTLEDWTIRWASMSNRERDVALALAMGQTSAEIVTRLRIAVKTLDIHRASVTKRLGVPPIGVPRVYFALKLCGLIVP